MASGCARAVILIGMMLACCARASALDPSLDISQYAHTSWKSRDGFVKGLILSIAQTPDGYLWLGTELGLLRFDGVHAVPWQPGTGKQLPSDFITPLLASHDGTLWIGTRKGLASWKNGTLTDYPEVAGATIATLYEDRGGAIWFGTVEIPDARLCRIRGGKVECYGAGRFGSGITAIYEDREGSLWIASVAGVWRWAPDAPQRFAYPRGLIEVDSLIQNGSGTLLLASNVGLKQLVGGKIQDYRLPGVSGEFRPNRFFRSSDGSLWIGSQQGLLHLHQGRVDIFNASDGLSGDFVGWIFEDREGNVWVAAQDGLDRFRDVAVPAISRNQGLSNSAAWSVQATSDGSVWIGTPDGLNRWQNGHITVYRNRHTLGQGRMDRRELSTSGRTTEIANSGLPNAIRSLGLDDSGRLWVAAGNDVYYFDGDHFARVAGVPGGNIMPIAGDGHGNTWILNSGVGLFLRQPSGAVRQIPESRFKQKLPLVLLPDQSANGLWIGFFQGGIAYLKEGQVRASYSTSDGLGQGEINDLRFGSQGALWIGTEGGLSRIKDGHIATLTSRNGLPCDDVLWSIQDDDQAAWLYMTCGLARIERSELDAWVADPKRTIRTTVFDTSDGVAVTGINSGYGPHVTKTPDGRIWFAVRNGVSFINPRHIPLNKLPPPVHIEQITADGKTYGPSDGQKLPRLVRDLTIDYTALSLAVPEKVHFRYKLEGQDKDWREVVNVRQVQYSNLPPRHYRFRVIASNNSGVWNEEGATLDFTIPPAWYQTNWFRALCVVAFVALLWMLYQLRVRQLRREEKKLREAIETIPAMAWIAGPDGLVQFVNRRWVEYSGVSEIGSAEVTRAMIHPEDVDRVMRRWYASIASGAPFEEEIRFRRADGVYRWLLNRAVPLRDKRGKVVKWYGAATDIEDRKRAEELQSDLAHVNRVTTLGEMAASLAHEIKQPIAGAITSANSCRLWLGHDPPNIEKALAAVNRIEKDGNRAADIIDRLKSLYKKAPPQRALVAVNEVIGEMIVLLRGEANRYGVSIRTDLIADLPMVMADRVQIQQVLMNLMLNGIEAMKDTGGVLTVGSQLSRDGQVMISVTDTGVGLPPERAGRIFEAFFTTKPQGSGMGLAISRSIIESHGGRIWATANDGRGAAFQFTLPVAIEGTPVSAAEMRSGVSQAAGE